MVRNTVGLATGKGYRLNLQWVSRETQGLRKADPVAGDTGDWTGHSNLSSYLHRFGIRESGRCACGLEDETPEHVRDVCVLGPRREVRKVIRVSGVL